MGQSIQEWPKSNLRNTAFKKYFNGCLPQILLGPFLNNLSHMFDMVLNAPQRESMECFRFQRFTGQVIPEKIPITQEMNAKNA